MEDIENTTTNETTTTWGDAADASAEADLDAAFPPRNFRALHLVDLTEKEVADRAKKAASARAQVAEYEAAKKDANDHWKAKIELAENERDGLLDAIALGTEMRMVEVIEHRMFRLGVVRVVRADTGEQVSERAMTAAERQPSLPGVATEDDETGDEQPEERSAPSLPFDDDGEPSIEDPQAVLDGALQEEATKKKTRRAKRVAK